MACNACASHVLMALMRSCDDVSACAIGRLSRQMTAARLDRRFTRKILFGLPCARHEFFDATSETRGSLGHYRAHDRSCSLDFTDESGAGPRGKTHLFQVSNRMACRQ